MPYTSATAEIMYAPLDLRFVTRFPRDSVYRRSTKATDRNGCSRIEESNPCRSVQIRGSMLLRCRLRLLPRRRPSCRLQQVIDGVRHHSGADQNHSESKRAHAQDRLMIGTRYCEDKQK